MLAINLWRERMMVMVMEEEATFNYRNSNITAINNVQTNNNQTRQ